MAFVLIEVIHQKDEIYPAGRLIYTPVLDHGSRADLLKIKQFRNWRKAAKFAEESQFQHYIICEMTSLQKRNFES